MSDRIVVLDKDSRVTFTPEELTGYVLQKKIVVVPGNLPNIEKMGIVSEKAVICSSKYWGYFKTALGELCISETVFLKQVASLTFVSDGFNVKTLDSSPPWTCVKTCPLEDDKIATEFIPFTRDWAVIASPLSSESFRYVPHSDTVWLAYMYLSPPTPYLTLLRKIKDTALAVLEEETGIKRGKGYDELMQIARETATDVIRRQKIKLFLKFESKIKPEFGTKIAPNPLIPENLFPELKTIAEQINEIPESAEDQLKLLKNF